MVETSLRYRFADVVVDPSTFQILRAGEPQSVEPKSFRVLLYLIERRDRVVPKDELIQAVWKDTFVTDNVLTRSIAQLRKALGDNVKQARYIETVPTVGYRFIGDLDAKPEVVLPPIQTPRHRASIWVVGTAVAVGVIAGILTWREVADRQTPSPRITQFTTSAGLDAFPSFSPDGSAIVYTSDRSGRFEIYVAPLASGGREMQVTTDGGQNIQPAWSPDGRYIAYVSAKRGGIFVVPALGGLPRQVTDFGAQPSWSPDSSRIAFRSDGVYSVSQADYLPTSVSTIWTVEVAGGRPKPLTKRTEPPGRHSAPSWSPDGKSILFSSFSGLGPPRLWIVPSEGGAATRVAEGSDRGFMEAAWAPDGKHLYFGGMYGEQFGLWRVPLSGGKPEPIVVNPAAHGRAGNLAVSKDGKRLAFTSSWMSSNLWSLPLDGGPPAALTRDTSARNTHPDFSPDGSKIAWFVRRHGSMGDIWVMDANGTNPVQITSNPRPDHMPNWAPDGRRVIYASKRGPDVELWSTSLDNGAEEPYGNLGTLKGSPYLSPHGREVVYHLSDKGVLNVWKASVDTGQSTQLTFDKESMGYPRWSPDGQWISFEIARGSDTHLAVVPSAGGPHTQLTFERGQSWAFGWSPDSEKISYAAFRDGSWNIWWLSRSTGERRKLTNYTSLREFVRYPAWSPLNERLVYEYSESRGNIYLIDLQ